MHYQHTTRNFTIQLERVWMIVGPKRGTRLLCSPLPPCIWSIECIELFDVVIFLDSYSMFGGFKMIHS